MSTESENTGEPREPFSLLAGPPPVERPSSEIFAAMGEERIGEMIRDLYRRLGDSEIAWMFPDDMDAAAERSAAFFIGLLGGPPRYHERFGQPRLRARHMPFRIDVHARDVWLACFRATLVEAPEQFNFPPEHLDGFVDFLEAFSLWMVNAPGERKASI